MIGHIRHGIPPSIAPTEVMMDYALIAVILGAVLPLYPALFSIYQKMGKYDEVCREFCTLRAEHCRIMEMRHGP